MSYKHFKEPGKSKKEKKEKKKPQAATTGLPSFKKSAPPMVITRQVGAVERVGRSIANAPEGTKRHQGAWVVRSDDATKQIAISFNDVTKIYTQYKSERQQFLSLLLSNGKAQGIHSESSRNTIYANQHLSFVVARGESIAFLGRNGAGKSTALKMITGVAYPTRGRLEINGKVSGLLELGAGFDKKLTGMENILLRAQIAGLGAKEIEQLLPQVADFAELGDFIDKPLRTYSSGMRARLGFAFASSVSPDILLVDEVLSVGDAEFQRKCRARVEEMLSRENLTTIFVTHSLTQAKQFCKRGIVIDAGKAVFDGPIENATAFYQRMTS
jgi:teichoic acid transport system ATP-binding protein